jgi:hypothetical protein
MMIKTIPVTYRAGVFVPLTAVKEIAEETILEIAVHLPPQTEDEFQDETEYTLAENLALLQQTSGMLRSDLSADEIHYLVESPQLAEESIWLALEPVL